MKNPFGLILVLCVLLLPSLVAQKKAEPDQSLLTAVQFRAELVTGVPDNRKAAEEAVDKLRAQRNPSGLSVDVGADFAFAAIDIGQRLLAERKPTAAEEFFKAAEESLVEAVQDTTSEKAVEKAQYLAKLALIRGNYLGKRSEAFADAVTATNLQPEDTHLQQLRDMLATNPRNTIKANVEEK